MKWAVKWAELVSHEVLDGLVGVGLILGQIEMGVEKDTQMLAVECPTRPLQSVHTDYSCSMERSEAPMAEEAHDRIRGVEEAPLSSFLSSHSGFYQVVFSLSMERVVLC